RDDLADQQRLGERGRRAENAEDHDDREHPLVFENVGQQLTEGGAGAVILPAAEGRTGPGRGGGAHEFFLVVAQRRPYLLWTAWRDTPSAVAIICQPMPRFRALRTSVAS